jgi:molybdopterin-guanine dinucleotide biosynthesis adapter protein
MRRIHIIGRKNHGKTQLVVELVEEFAARGLRVGTIKHTHHHHELDTPGKDSHRHRMAGAAAVGILSKTMSAVFFPTERMPAGRDRYADFAAIFAEFDLVIVEGDTQAQAPKIEVWRAALGSEPLAVHDPTILAVVTDDPLPIARPVYSRADVQALASWIREQVLG